MEFIIASDYDNVRLDRFLRQTYGELRLSQIFRMIRTGRVKVNGRKRKQSYRLRERDVVRVQTPATPSPAKELVQLSVRERSLAAESIVHADQDILVCNKPPGLVMHRGSGHDLGLVEMIQTLTANPQFTFVNRIDRDTSGLVIGANHPAALRKLAALFRERRVEKYYLALVEGRVREEQFSRTSYLHRGKERVSENEHGKGKFARSSFAVLGRYGNTTLLQARLHTGRTHQLRVQLAGLGHPIVGDAKYGHAGERMLLFSRRLVIPGMDLDLTLPVPDCFRGDRQGG